MYKIPETFDLKILKDEEVRGIYYYSNLIVLRFDSALSISLRVTYTIELESEKKDFDIDEDFANNNREGLVYLASLVNRKIEDAYTDSLRMDLRIRFSNNLILTLVNNQHYESYEIKFGTDKKEYIM